MDTTEYEEFRRVRDPFENEESVLASKAALLKSAKKENPVVFKRGAKAMMVDDASEETLQTKRKQFFHSLNSFQRRQRRYTRNAHHRNLTPTEILFRKQLSVGKWIHE